MDSNVVQAKLAEDPGDPVAIEYGEYLRVKHQYDEAMRILYAALSANPGLYRARLLLSRIYFELRYIPFAIRELEELNRAMPANQSIVKLLAKFGKSASPAVSQPVVSTDNLNQSSTSGTLAGSQSAGQVGVAPSLADKAVLADKTIAEVEIEFDALDLLESERKEGPK